MGSCFQCLWCLVSIVLVAQYSVFCFFLEGQHGVIVLVLVVQYSMFCIFFGRSARSNDFSVSGLVFCFGFLEG